MKAALTIYGFGSEAPIAGRLVRSGKTGRVFFLSDAGALYTTRSEKGVTPIPREKLSLYMGTSEMDALRSLGVVTTAEIKAARIWENKHRAREKKQRAKVQLRDAAKVLGISLKKLKAQ